MSKLVNLMLITCMNITKILDRYVNSEIIFQRFWCSTCSVSCFIISFLAMLLTWNKLCTSLIVKVYAHKRYTELRIIFPK
jgi:hypothetical protein